MLVIGSEAQALGEARRGAGKFRSRRECFNLRTYSSTFISSGIGAIPCSIFSYVAILAQTFIAPGSLPFVGTRLVGSGSLARLTQEPHLLEAPAEEHRANANNVRNRS